MITNEFDTIAAISTPLGEGAIGIVRLSGTEALAIAQKSIVVKTLTRLLHIRLITVTLLTLILMKCLMRLWCL